MRPRPSRRLVVIAIDLLAGKPTEVGGDQIDGVPNFAGVAILEPVLPDAAAHMHQVAGLHVLRDIVAGALAEDDDFIPVRVILPVAAIVLAAVVGADRNPRCTIEGGDPADVTEDLELCVVFHSDLPKLLTGVSSGCVAAASI